MFYMVNIRGFNGIRLGMHRCFSVIPFLEFYGFSAQKTFDSYRVNVTPPRDWKYQEDYTYALCTEETQISQMLKQFAPDEYQKAFITGLFDPQDNLRFITFAFSERYIPSNTWVFVDYPTPEKIKQLLPNIPQTYSQSGKDMCIVEESFLIYSDFPHIQSINGISLGENNTWKTEKIVTEFVQSMITNLKLKSNQICDPRSIYGLRKSEEGTQDFSFLVEKGWKIYFLQKENILAIYDQNNMLFLTFVNNNIHVFYPNPLKQKL